MNDFRIKENPEVSLVFDNYPEGVKEKMLALRELILVTAKNIEEIQEVEETLKWGEPSYLTKIGSTIRIDWKKKSPDQYAMYFQCTSRLVETFRLIFKNTFEFEGKRAIVFQLNDRLPKEQLQHCIKAGLRYHKVKHLPTLGI